MVRNIVEVVEDKCEEGLYRDENFRANIYRDRVGFSEARSIVEGAMLSTGHRVNRVDLYNHVLPWGSGHHTHHQTHHQNVHHQNVHHQNVHHEQSHVVSRPEVVNTFNHYESNVRPVVIEPRVQALPPVTTTTNTNFVANRVSQPVVTSNANFRTNSYTPYNAGISSTSKNSKYMFNYQQPKEYFHPDMTYQRF